MGTVIFFVKYQYLKINRFSPKARNFSLPMNRFFLIRKYWCWSLEISGRVRSLDLWLWSRLNCSKCLQATFVKTAVLKKIQQYLIKWFSMLAIFLIHVIISIWDQDAPIIFLNNICNYYLLIVTARYWSPFYRAPTGQFFESHWYFRKQYSWLVSATIARKSRFLICFYVI